MKNYKNERGIVGQYKGTDVEVIPYMELSAKAASRKDRIWAVVMSLAENLQLVYGDKWIGTMSSEGKITLFDRNVIFRFHEDKVKEVERKSSTPAAKEPTVGEFSEYSKEVDNFFKGLNQLWQEIDQSFKE